MKNFTRLFDLERTPLDGAQAPSDVVAPVMDFSASAVLRTAPVKVDPAALERARILPSGAGGPNGAPYKMLRTQVLRRLEQLGATSLAVISPCSQDGKTLTAINLAITIAAAADRTSLLVDFDLRNPGIHKRFGFEPQAGADDCLQSGVPPQDALVRIEGYERLTVLPTRARVEQSSELLNTQRAGDLVTELRNRYLNRIMIFDLPPVLQADDVLAFSRHIQAALLVVNERHTRREDVTRTLELLRDTPVVGTVLNGSRTPDTQYYY